MNSWLPTSADSTLLKPNSKKTLNVFQGESGIEKNSAGRKGEEQNNFMSIKVSDNKTTEAFSFIEKPIAGANKLGTNSVFASATSPIKPEDKLEVKTKPEEKNKTKAKTKESLDAFFGRYYTGYKNADENGKVKFIKQYFGSLNEKQQLKEFERLRQAGAEPQQIERLARVIGKLNKNNQLKAADDIMNKNKDEKLNKAGRKGVAQTIQEFDKSTQTKATAMLVKTKDEIAIIIASKHASECNEANQIEIVKIYQKLENETVSKNIIDQYGKFAKQNEVAIHTTMSSSTTSSIVEYAAANTWKFHPENQQAAVQVTINTGNEAAINAAANQIHHYDPSVQTSINSTLANTGYASVQQTLANAPYYPTSSGSDNGHDNTSSSSNGGTSNYNNYATYSHYTTTSENLTIEETFQNANFFEQLKMLSSSNISNNESLMKDFIDKASPAQKLALLSSLPPNMLSQLINALLDNNPAPEILAKIVDVIGNGSFQDKEKEALFAKLQGSRSATFLASQGSLSSDTTFIRYMATKGELSSLKENELSGAAKDVYKELKEKQTNRTV